MTQLKQQLTAQLKSQKKITMNNSKPKKQVNDYVLLFSAGAALSVVFLWLASYIFPEGEIIGGRRVFENIPKSIQYIFYILSASSIFISGYLFSLRAKNWSRGSEEKRKVKMWAIEKGQFATGIELYPGERVLVPTGLIFNIPEGYSVRLHTRSSVSLKKGLTMPNGEGIIDSDYYHQTFVMLYNAGADEVRIYHGDRIAQGELVENVRTKLEETKDVPEQTTSRVGGFGSTGVK